MQRLSQSPSTEPHHSLSIEEDLTALQDTCMELTKQDGSGNCAM